MGAFLKGDLILLTESDIFKIWIEAVQMYHIKAQISKRRQLFGRSTTEVQRRRHKGHLTGSVTCTFEVQRPAEDNLTKETAQYEKHTASGFNQTSRLNNILHLKKEGTKGGKEHTLSGSAHGTRNSSWI